MSTYGQPDPKKEDNSFNFPIPTKFFTTREEREALLKSREENNLDLFGRPKDAAPLQQKAPEAPPAQGVNQEGTRAPVPAATAPTFHLSQNSGATNMFAKSVTTAQQPPAPFPTTTQFHTFAEMPQNQPNQPAQQDQPPKPAPTGQQPQSTPPNQFFQPNQPFQTAKPAPALQTASIGQSNPPAQSSNQFFAPKSATSGQPTAGQAQTTNSFFAKPPSGPDSTGATTTASTTTSTNFFNKPPTSGITTPTPAFNPGAPVQTQQPSKVTIKPAEEKEVIDILRNFQLMTKEAHPACIYRSFSLFPHEAVT
jgi:hypothetical protein